MSDEHNGGDEDKGLVVSQLVMLVLLLCLGALGAPCPSTLTLKGTTYVSGGEGLPLQHQLCEERGARGGGQGCLFKGPWGRGVVLYILHDGPKCFMLCACKGILICSSSFFSLTMFTSEKKKKVRS